MRKYKKEIWKDVAGSGGRYSVSSMGRLRCNEYTIRVNSRSGIFPKKLPAEIFKPSKNNYGYHQTTIALVNSKRRWVVTIHRLVALTFIPNPENKPQINHKNGIKSDNHVENLEWVTQAENARHASKLGLIRAGESNGASKMKKSGIHEVFKLREKGCSQYEIANKFNVNQATISHILNRRTWTTVKIK